MGQPGLQGDCSQTLKTVVGVSELPERLESALYSAPKATLLMKVELRTLMLKTPALNPLARNKRNNVSEVRFKKLVFI
jgi:hypothetical protein